MASVIEMHRDKITATGATIRVEELPTITGNENQLYILFRNLFSNAITYHQPGNKPLIQVTTQRIKGTEIGDARANEAKEYIRISVTDNGLGFDARFAKKIFQVFQRLHHQHEFPGTGIGLAICRKVMENHEGFIAAESEADKGASFHCYFPVT
jgi:signal transduction histidine kinase